MYIQTPPKNQTDLFWKKAHLHAHTTDHSLNLDSKEFKLVYFFLSLFSGWMIGRTDWQVGVANTYEGTDENCLHTFDKSKQWNSFVKEHQVGI